MRAALVRWLRRAASLRGKASPLPPNFTPEKKKRRKEIKQREVRCSKSDGRCRRASMRVLLTFSNKWQTVDRRRDENRVVYAWV